MKILYSYRKMSTVLESCSLVAEKAAIKIDLNCARVLALKIYDEIINDRLNCQNFTRVSVHPQEKNNITANWIFVVNTLNFCFWSHKNKYWQVTWHGVAYTGYFALCAAVNRAIEDGIDLTRPEVYANLTFDEFSHVLRGDKNTNLLLMKERYQCLLECGRILIEKFDGSFVNCIHGSNKLAQNLLNIIVSNFSHFRDEAKYQDIKVCFYKRAQIVIGDLYQCFEGKGLGEFSDINTITMFADYRVPQVLCYFGVLQYPDSLLSKLIDGIMLENGSIEEIEIRATSVVAVAKINEFVQDLLKTNNSQHKCNCILIDTYLWTYRRNRAKYLDCIPYHKTQTIYY